MDGWWTVFKAGLKPQGMEELRSLQTALLKRLAWLLLALLALLALNEAVHARPSLTLHLALMVLVALGLAAVGRWKALRPAVIALVLAGILLAVWMEAGFYDIAVPPATAFLVMCGAFVTLIVGPSSGLLVTVAVVAGQLWLEHLYPIDSARTLRSVGNSIIAVAWVQLTALLFQRLHSQLARRLVAEQRSLRDAVNELQGLAQTAFDGLQAPLLTLELRLSAPGPLTAAELAPQLDALRAQLQKAREQAREAAHPQSGGAIRDQLGRLRQVGLLTQLWAGWAALLASTAQGFIQGLPAARILPDAMAAVLLGAALLVFRRRLSALRPITWAAATLVLILIGWSLGQWGSQYPAPPYYFLAPLVMAMALLDGIVSGTVVAVACGGLVLWSSSRGPLGPNEFDQALYMLGTVFLALFASAQALMLHGDLDQRLTAEGAALQKALRLRRRLLGTLFHDLSNPLAMLQLTVDLGEDQAMDYAERGRLHLLVDRMQSLVELARDFVAIDGPLPPDHIQAVPLGPLLNDLREQLQPRLQAAGHELRIYCPPQLEALASPVVLRESVVSNLLKLAMARCSAGAKLTLSVSTQSDGVILRLQDPGRPLSQEDLQATGSLPQGDEGPGVALALVQEHLARMGGGLALTNLEDGGSMATVRLRPVDQA